MQMRVIKEQVGHLAQGWYIWQEGCKTFTFTFTFRAFGRRSYPKRLTKRTFVEGEAAI